MAIEPISAGMSGMVGMGASGGFSARYGNGGMSVYRKAAGNSSLPRLNTSVPDVGAYSGHAPEKNGRAGNENDLRRRFDSFECQTCKNRKYQDGSDDSGVSFQTPTRVDPKAAGAAVRSHEQEHVGRNQAKAEREGKKIISQSVTIHTAICPECGRVYVSGGTTKTVTGNDNSRKNDRYGAGLSDPTSGKGELLNLSA